jgi:hypothetical protein
MALKTLSKSNILNGNIVQASDVSQSVDAFTGIEGYAISLSGSFTFLGATTGSGFFQNAVNAVSASYALSSSYASGSSNSISSSVIYVASNASTNTNYTLVFKNSTGALDNFYQLAADGTNGPYYNPSTNVLGGANGNLTISGSVGNFNTITGSLSGSVNGTASFATTASYALTASYASNGVTNLSVGTFYDTSTQTLTANNSASITLNTPVINDGITVVSNSRLTVTRTGIYNLQFSAQLVTTVGGSPEVSIWLRKNGSNVTYSGTNISIQNQNSKYVAAWNFVESLNAGDYLELIWYVYGGASAQLLAETPSVSNGGVGVPSVIVTITQVK